MDQNSLYHDRWSIHNDTFNNPRLACTVDYLVLLSLEITFRHYGFPTDFEQIETETKQHLIPQKSMMK